MASDHEKRQRHEAAMVRAYQVLSGQKTDEELRERQRKSTQKARRVIAELDAKQARADAVRQHHQEATRRARETLARLQRREQYESLTELNKRLLSASETERRQIIGEVIEFNLRRWPTKRTWQGKTIAEFKWLGKKTW
jgi:hypothetical protein